LNRARARGEDFNLVLVRYATERSVVAEKLEAIASLGMANSRLKDYFDLRALAREGVLDEQQLAQAITATFGRRRTAIPTSMPLGLTNEFARDPLKQAQWKAFLSRNRLDVPALEQVVTDVRRFVAVPLERARGSTKDA
jgi:hypothetical protein